MNFRTLLSAANSSWGNPGGGILGYEPEKRTYYSTRREKKLTKNQKYHMLRRKLREQK